MQSTPQQPILLVEDSPEDFEMTIRSLRASGLMNPIKHCQDGEEALEYLLDLRNKERASSSLPPDMILLDLNLPGTNGRELLSEIKQDPALKLIPVIILTTSTDERDVNTCYKLGANSYIHKPLNLQAFIKSMRKLKDYWFDVVVKPQWIAEVPS